VSSDNDPLSEESAAPRQWPLRSRRRDAHVAPSKQLHGPSVGALRVGVERGSQSRRNWTPSQQDNDLWCSGESNAGFGLGSDASKAMALFKRSRKAPEPPLPFSPDITIYLGDDYRTFEPDEGVQITIDGYSPFLDEALTISLEENQEELAAEGIIYSRIVGGTHHKADINNAAFDLGSKLGLVGLVHQADNPADPNAMAVCAVANKTIYTAGYLPRKLAAVVAPLLGSGGAANAVVIETVSRGGTRTGLKIIAAMGHDMMVKSVSR
jgi:hypothetical protein